MGTLNKLVVPVSGNSRGLNIHSLIKPLIVTAPDKCTASGILFYPKIT